jgi:hypothetical protein
LSDISIDMSCILRHRIPDTPPWLLQAAQFELSLHEIGSKSDVPPDVFRSRFNDIISAFSGYITDRSKEYATLAGMAVTVSENID